MDYEEDTEIVSNFGNSLEIVSPYANAPFPLYLEHTGVVVGWCNVREDSKGLLLESGRIINNEVFDQIENGVLKGFSVGGLVKEPICSVCKKNYIHCEHISGKKYSGVNCFTELQEIDLADISLVKNPINPLANIKFERM